MFRRAGWPVWTACLGGVATLLWLYDRSECGSIACGVLPMRVRGAVIDAATGAPVEGASLLRLLNPEHARDPEYVARRRSYALGRSELPAEVSVQAASAWGSARTDDGGRFEFILLLPTSETRGRLGISWRRTRASPLGGARALLVEKEGYITLVHETRDARWDEREEDGLVGTLGVGTIRLAHEQPR